MRNINGEIYIVLKTKDFEQIGVNIGKTYIGTKDCIECESNSSFDLSDFLARSGAYKYENYAADNQCWLVQKQNAFSDKDKIIYSQYTCGRNMKFLFKLIEK